MYRNPYAAAQAEGKRSGFEVRVCKELDALKIPYEYEEHTVRYTFPEEARRYTPDLVFPNGVVVELKGEWDTQDRKKIRLVHAEYPDLDLRLVFDNQNRRISSQSKTTYGVFCASLGLPFSSKSIPIEWLREPVNRRSLAALKKATQVGTT